MIDADKLKSELFDADWMMDNDEHMVEKIVERQPTVDAEPFITGETSDGYDPIGKANDTDPLTINDYQRMARRTAGTKQKSDKMEEALFGLAGEVGELCDHYKKFMHQGHDINYEHMAEEAGDVMWYLAEIADALGVTLEDIARRNIDKLRKRYPDGFDPERSINREEEHEDHH